MDASSSSAGMITSIVATRVPLSELLERARALDPRRWLWRLGAVYSALAAAAAMRLAVEWIVLLLLVASVVFALAGAAAAHGRSRLGLGRIVAAAIAFRVLFVFLTPTLSDDVWRYLWDGKVARAGINPYAHAPDASALVALRDEDWGRVNHRSIPTIYPPVAQVLFRIAAPGGLAAWKGIVLAFDVLTMMALARGLRAAGRPIEQLVFYAWNPLILVELVWNAHVDAAAAALLACAVVACSRGKQRGATALVSLAAGVKVFPVLLLPRVVGASRLHRAWWIPFAIGGVFTAPYLGAGWRALLTALCVYARNWEFNGFVYETLRHVGANPRGVRLALVGLLLAATGVATARVRAPADAALWIVFTVVVLNPTVHPWYVTWIVPLAVLATGPPRVTALLLSLVVPLSYVVLAVRESTGSWFLPESWLRLEWWPVVAMLTVELTLFARAHRRVG